MVTWGRTNLVTNQDKSQPSGSVLHPLVEIGDQFLLVATWVVVPRSTMGAALADGERWFITSRGPDSLGHDSRPWMSTLCHHNVICSYGRYSETRSEVYLFALWMGDVHLREEALVDSCQVTGCSARWP